MIYVKFKRLTETAMMPTRGSSEAAGYDLYVDTDREIAIHPGETVPFYTGIAIEIPYGYAGFIHSRSGIAVKKGLRIAMGTGVVDSDYRGNIGVPLHNDSNEIQYVAPHERVAQIVFQEVEDAQFYESSGSLSHTVRGTGGFGSTGR